jgi:hypothetical protein
LSIGPAESCTSPPEGLRTTSLKGRNLQMGRDDQNVSKSDEKNPASTDSMRDVKAPPNLMTLRWAKRTNGHSSSLIWRYTQNLLRTSSV